MDKVREVLGALTGAHKAEEAATLPHPVHSGAMKAPRVSVERHSPSLVEQELGASLQPAERTGHRGVDCASLPHNHAHPLPAYDAVSRKEPELTEPEARAELLQAETVAE